MLIGSRSFFVLFFLLILWDIPLRRSCHVQTEIVLFLPPHAFSFPFLCYCNGQNFHSVVEEERWQGKSVPSLWSEGKEFTFSPLSIILAVGFLKILFKSSWDSYFLSFYYEWPLDFAKCCLSYWYYHMNFLSFFSCWYNWLHYLIFNVEPLL